MSPNRGNDEGGSSCVSGSGLKNDQRQCSGQGSAGPHRVVNLNTVPPSSKGVPSCKPHSSPQPSAVHTVRNSPAPACADNRTACQQPSCGSFQPAFVAPFSTHQLPQAPSSSPTTVPSRVTLDTLHALPIFYMKSFLTHHFPPS